MNKTPPQVPSVIPLPEEARNLVSNLFHQRVQEQLSGPSSDNNNGSSSEQGDTEVIVQSNDPRIGGGQQLLRMKLPPPSKPFTSASSTESLIQQASQVQNQDQTTHSPSFENWLNLMEDADVPNFDITLPPDPHNQSSSTTCSQNDAPTSCTEDGQPLTQQPLGLQPHLVRPSGSSTKSRNEGLMNELALASSIVSAIPSTITTSSSTSTMTTTQSSSKTSSSPSSKKSTGVKRTIGAPSLKNPSSSSGTSGTNGIIPDAYKPFISPIKKTVAFKDPVDSPSKEKNISTPSSKTTSTPRSTSTTSSSKKKEPVMNPYLASVSHPSSKQTAKPSNSTSGAVTSNGNTTSTKKTSTVTQSTASSSEDNQKGKDPTAVVTTDMVTKDPVVIPLNQDSISELEAQVVDENPNEESEEKEEEDSSEISEEQQKLMFMKTVKKTIAEVAVPTIKSGVKEYLEGDEFKKSLTPSLEKTLKPILNQFQASLLKVMEDKLKTVAGAAIAVSNNGKALQEAGKKLQDSANHAVASASTTSLLMNSFIAKQADDLDFVPKSVSKKKKSGSSKKKHKDSRKRKRDESSSEDEKSSKKKKRNGKHH